MIERCRIEVTQLHQFFEAWFTGRLDSSNTSFERFSRVMAEEFEMVSPDGALIAREELLERLRASHAAWREEPGRIRIESFRGRPLGGGACLATYQEWQQRGDEKRGRLSTAVFGDKPGAPNGVEWLHLHEVWLPV